MGAIDYLANFFTVTANGKRRKRKPLQTVEIKVKMCCDGCERIVRSSVSHMKGVKSVTINRKESRVTVHGYVEPKHVLKSIKRSGKIRAEFWPYIQYNLVSHPYTAGTYDKKAPSGYVRNVVPGTTATDETITTLFSDDNPNSCTIM